MEEYIKRYKTGRTGIIWTLGLLLFTLLILVVSLFIKIPGISALPVIFSLLFAGFFFISLRGYKELVLFEDRLEVSSIFGGQIYLVEYATIKHMGFLTESVGAYNYYARTSLGDARLQSLIFLLYGGGRVELDGSEFDHLHEVYAFIQERTNL